MTTYVALLRGVNVGGKAKVEMPKLKKLFEELGYDVDTLLYVSGSIVWHFDRKYYTKSSMRKFIGTPVYKHMTARNINTLRKLAALCA